jgi:nucleotide-binding universal stress UspA family protein
LLKLDIPLPAPPPADDHWVLVDEGFNLAREHEIEVEHATLHIVPIDVDYRSPTDMARKLRLDSEQFRGYVFDSGKGEPAENILRRSTELPGALVVIPRWLRASKRGLGLGQITIAVLRSATTPIVLVSPETSQTGWQLQRILLPHDGTPTMAAAMRPAIELAIRSGAELLALHIATSARSEPPEPGTLTPPYYADQPQHEWPAWATEFLERLRALGPGLSEIKIRMLLGAGDPAAGILRACRGHNTDLTVLAWQGVWRAERASVMKSVLQGTHSPVLIMRASA